MAVAKLGSWAMAILIAILPATSEAQFQFDFISSDHDWNIARLELSTMNEAVETRFFQPH